MTSTSMTGSTWIKLLARVARSKPYRLHVGEWKPGPVAPVHSAHSYHNLTFADGTGRAFDANTPPTVLGNLRMARYARHLRKHYHASLTECIYNGRWTKVSIKNGEVVPYEYWGAQTWDAHRTHVHVAI